MNFIIFNFAVVSNVNVRSKIARHDGQVMKYLVKINLGEKAYVDGYNGYLIESVGCVVHI